MIFTLSMTAASVVFLGGPCCQNHVWIVAFYAGSSGLEELNLFGNDLYMAIVNWAAAPIALIKLLQVLNSKASFFLSLFFLINIKEPWAQGNEFFKDCIQNMFILNSVA